MTLKGDDKQHDAYRKKKAAQMRSAPGRLRGQLDDVLAKLESERR